jgi:PAS domain S-box-containing protein
MLRPDPEQTVFGYIPVRLIVSLIILFTLVMTVVLVLGIQHEKNIVEGLLKATDLPPEKFLGFERFSEDLIKIALVLFLLGGIGISVLVTYQHYHTTKKTLEQVKSLARNILKSVPNGILTVDQEGRVTAINPVAEQILSLSATQALGQSYLGLFPEEDPIHGILSGALDGRQYLQDQDISYPVASSQQVAIRVTVSELKDHRQAYAGVVLLLRDVSELLILEQQLRRSEKLSALHTLSAGVAHEIRNPLSALDLNLHLLEDELSEEHRARPAVKKYLDVLSVEIQRLKDILDNFMRFSKPLALKMERVDLARVLHHILRLLGHEASEKSVRFEISVPEKIPPVQGDETELSQVFLNIIINALQAMPRGGILKVSAVLMGEPPRQAIEVRISDTGIGIPKQNLPKLFEPFFTTKEYGGGLGLPITYRIVEDHGGSIHIESHEGTGTTVAVRLPSMTGVERMEPV